MITEIKSILHWRTRRKLEKLLNYKFPRFTYVDYSLPHIDMVKWGKRRWKYSTRNGSRDNRYSWNYKVTIPTEFVYNLNGDCYTIQQGDLDKASIIAAKMQPIMDIIKYDNSILAKAKDTLGMFNYNIEELTGFFDFKAGYFYVRETTDLMKIQKDLNGMAVYVMEKRPKKIVKDPSIKVWDRETMDKSLREGELIFY